MNSKQHRCKRYEELNQQGNQCFNDADCLYGRKCKKINGRNICDGRFDCSGISNAYGGYNNASRNQDAIQWGFDYMFNKTCRDNKRSCSNST